MTAQVHAQGAWQPVSSRFVRVAGQWRKVLSHYVYRGGWQLVQAFVPPFSATADSAQATGSSYSPKPRTENVTSSAVNITPTGGSLPFTYTWTRTDGDTRVTVSSTSAASVTFSALLNADEADADFSWVVTDANGASATGTVSVTLIQENGFGPQ